MAGDRVECRSDHDYIGRPLAFYWQDKRLTVSEVLAQNRTPHSISFRVRNNVYGEFVLEYDINICAWSVHQP